MRSLLVVAALATSAHAGPSPVTIENSALWPSHPKAVSVRIGAGPWQKVATQKTVAAPPIKAPAGGKAIAIDVQAPSGSKAHRRWAVVVPDHTYKIVGNPCGTWGLEVDPAPEGDEKLQVDASALSPKLFPLVISTDHAGEGEPEPDAILEAPGSTAAIVLAVSAMCPRSGASVIIYSRATKRRLFDLSLVAHPGVLHTMRLSAGGGFTITVAR